MHAKHVCLEETDTKNERLLMLPCVLQGSHSAITRLKCFFRFEDTVFRCYPTRSNGPIGAIRGSVHRASCVPWTGPYIYNTEPASRPCNLHTRNTLEHIVYLPMATHDMALAGSVIKRTCCIDSLRPFCISHASPILM